MSKTEVKSVFPPLEEPCTECDSKGGEKCEYTQNWYPCDVCDGIGCTLTDTGEALLRFLDHVEQRRKSRNRPSWPI